MSDMQRTQRAKYVGPSKELKGKHATVRERRGNWEAQFEHIGLEFEGDRLDLGWHIFTKDCFEVV